ncbi:MAG: hypothetical protein AAFR79_04465 [Pseudomonadota bacterium]
MTLSDRAYSLAGWWLFILGAALFIVSSARAGDMVALAGSVAFMAANIVFLTPYYRKPMKKEGRE